MASKTLINAVQSYDQYLMKDGRDRRSMRKRASEEQVMNAYTQACQVAMITEKDLEYGLNLTKRVKNMLNDYAISLGYADIFGLEHIFKGKDEIPSPVKYYYEILSLEAPYLFDSYLLYLEKNREYSRKFYEPRRKCLLKTGIVDALQDLMDGKLDILSISMPPSTGKAQPMYSKVLTPDGFIRMDEVKVGTKVISGTGNTCEVLGVYPQGKKPIYEITFDDGSKCRCSDEHLWTVQTRDDRNKKRYPNGKYRTIMLKDMLHNVKVEKNRKNYSVDYVKRIEFPKKHFEIEPYVMGVLLGDGGLSGGSIVVTSADQQVLDTMKMFMPLEYEFVHKGKHDYALKTNVYYTKGKSKYRKALDKYGLWGSKSDTKFIPKDYLTASYEQRLWLLRGLMDTDGTVDKRLGHCSYCTISEQLALDVAELAHSLGGFASIHKKKRGYKDKDGNYVRCCDAYELYIRIKDNADLFALDRKKQWCKNSRLSKCRYIESIEYVGEEECQCIYISDPSHLYVTDDYIVTHNTTIEKFFQSWVIGKHPNRSNLFFSHSGEITRMYYDGIYDITTSDEYAWKEIFPDVKMSNTNAKSEQINFNEYKAFPNVQCTSVGSKNAGKVRCDFMLMCDDLIGGIEEALNKNQLDKLWDIYSVDARQRKDGADCRELHICTRWSVHDIVGRLKMAYEGNDRARFIAIPDIDPETGESNFLYDVKGFTVEFFNEQARLMDDISYRCLYKNEPIEREGLLYHEEDMRTYLQLPDREPDAILSVCDTKNKGTDFLVMPVCYVYGNDHYCVDVVCNDSSDYGLQYEKLADMICEHSVQQDEFESNNGGDRVAFEVEKRVAERGCRCNITTKPTETNKETRIIVNADWVKKNVIFKDSSMYAPNSEYGVMMRWLFSYSVTGKNIHDDVPDCWANYALYVERQLGAVAEVTSRFF